MCLVYSCFEVLNAHFFVYFVFKYVNFPCFSSLYVDHKCIFKENKCYMRVNTFVKRWKLVCCAIAKVVILQMFVRCCY